MLSTSGLYQFAWCLTFNVILLDANLITSNLLEKTNAFLKFCTNKIDSRFIFFINRADSSQIILSKNNKEQLCISLGTCNYDKTKINLSELSDRDKQCLQAIAFNPEDKVMTHIPTSNEARSMASQIVNIRAKIKNPTAKRHAYSTFMHLSQPIMDEFKKITNRTITCNCNSIPSNRELSRSRTEYQTNFCLNRIN